MALSFAFIVLMDPYATGRFALTQRVDLTTDSWGFSKAGVVRDPQFDTAIVGSSTAMPLDPARLSKASGRHVVLLALQGNAPQYQLLLARTFVQSHAGRAITLVFIIDYFWCRDPFEKYEEHPFPAWLFERSDIDYLAHLFNGRAFDTAVRRLGLWIGLGKPAGRADGRLPLTIHNDFEVLWERLRQAKAPSDAPDVSSPYPDLDRLDRFVAALPPNANVVFVFSPVPAAVLAVPNSPAAARMARCKSRVQHTAAQRPGSNYLDLRIDHPLLRDVTNFLDTFHYREPVAQWIELHIAPLIARPQTSN